MLKAGLLPSPIITPLSSNSLSSKNKIDTQTFVELRSDVPNVRIYFTVDGTKPDPFQVFRTGYISTYLYRGAFRLGPGRRIVKAIAVTNNRLRESHVTTKYLDVNDIYSENYDDSPNEYSDNDQSLIDHYQSKHDFDRTAWDDAFNSQGSISPVNYIGTQINVWSIPGNNWIDPNRNSQYGQMIEYLPPRPPRIVDVTHEEENFWDRKTRPFSPDEQALRELFGWKKFGRIETAYLIDKGRTYPIVTTFKKLLGEQTSYEEPLPVRKPTSKLSVRQEESMHEKEKKIPRIYTEETIGLGTKEFTLNRIIITRSEIDLVQIKAAYNHLFNRKLECDVNRDTSGYYNKLLLQILKDPSQRN